MAERSSAVAAIKPTKKTPVPNPLLVTLAPAPADVAVSGIGQAVTIEPVDPDVYYVPVYNPAVAFGQWDYPSYPPFYWSPPGFVANNVVSFVAGVTVGAAIWGECDCWHNNVIIDVNRFNVFNHASVTNDTWIHNPEHRHDVPYRNASVARRFGSANEVAARDEFRDRAAAQHGDVSGDRADTQHPDAVHGMAHEAGDAAGKIAPALHDRHDGDFDWRADRPMSEREEFARPRGDARPQVMRSRVQAFRPERRAFGGSFRFGGGGRRRLRARNFRSTRLLTALVSMGQRADLEESQRQWLSTRDLCGKNTACPLKTYRSRIDALSAITDSISARGPF